MVSVRERSNVEVKDDIGYVLGGELVFDGSGDVKVVKGGIIGVLSCESYASCILL